MNIQEMDILNILGGEPFSSQRELAERSGHSLGAVNRCLRSLAAEGWLDDTMLPTEKALALFEESKPQRAIILAAGAGMRMVPINLETPKGLLQVRGETLVERLIRQLHEAGVRDITVVVGFMKDAYEFLIDQYDVRLLVNRDYAGRNNLHSLAMAADRLENAYILPCDVWCEPNPFAPRELYGWYMVADRPSPASTVRPNRRMELVSAQGGSAMVGPAYIPASLAGPLRQRLLAMDGDRRFDGAWWEDALFSCGETIYARVWPGDKAVEINTYEQLRELDSGSAHLRSEALSAAAAALGADPAEVRDIQVLKKGITNRSFLFDCRGERYVMRVPGEGTDKLINRRQEAAVYAAIRGKDLCDDPVSIDPGTGYKLTRFLDRVRVCDPESEDDVRRCMARLRAFHDMKLTVDHEFDLFGTIDYYEALRNGAPSIYRDYAQTKANVFSLRPFIEAHAEEKHLTHMDAVPDNFLFVGRDGADIQLIDWEYAGMQDPHVDIAMFAIYALYDREQTDKLIDAYFPEGCPMETRMKIYCYMAAGGLLWSNWCEYKRDLGVEFGEYSLRQYRYAKNCCRLVKEMGL